VTTLVVLAAAGVLVLWLRWRGRSYRQSERIGNAQTYAQSSDARFSRIPGFGGRASKGGRR
jgi:hypothetical protein